MVLILQNYGCGAMQAVITDFHVDSVVVVMENYSKTWKEIALFLTSLLRYKGLKVYHLGLGNRIRAAGLMRDHDLDFDAALAVQALKELAMKTIVSCDEDFDTVKWIERRVPENL